MEALEGVVAFDGEVGIPADEPVVVPAIDEEDGFRAGGGVGGAEEEVALAVGFFADIVASCLLAG